MTDINKDHLSEAYESVKKRGKTKGTVTVEMYVHGSRDTAYEEGASLGLDGDALSMFSYILTEFLFRFEINPETGTGKLTHVDGKRLVSEACVDCCNAHNLRGNLKCTVFKDIVDADFYCKKWEEKK